MEKKINVDDFEEISGKKRDIEQLGNIDNETKIDNVTNDLKDSLFLDRAITELNNVKSNWFNDCRMLKRVEIGRRKNENTLVVYAYIDEDHLDDNIEKIPKSLQVGDVSLQVKMYPFYYPSYSNTVTDFDVCNENFDCAEEIINKINESIKKHSEVFVKFRKNYNGMTGVFDKNGNPCILMYVFHKDIVFDRDIDLDDYLDGFRLFTSEGLHVQQIREHECNVEKIMNHKK